jgi:hypothetical protein
MTSGIMSHSFCSDSWKEYTRRNTFTGLCVSSAKAISNNDVSNKARNKMATKGKQHWHVDAPYPKETRLSQSEWPLLSGHVKQVWAHDALSGLKK